jgi:hypothetical protein
VFPAIRKYLDYCTREDIQLKALEARQRLLPSYENRQSIAFYMRPDEKEHRYEASYRLLGRSESSEFTRKRTTAAYMIHTEPVTRPDGRKGPRVLAIFGVSGTTGLVFSYQLRWQRIEPFQGLLADALSAPGITIVEIELTKDVPRIFTNLRFSDGWEYKRITKLHSEVADKMKTTELAAFQSVTA